ALFGGARSLVLRLAALWHRDRRVVVGWSAICGYRSAHEARRGAQQGGRRPLGAPAAGTRAGLRDACRNCPAVRGRARNRGLAAAPGLGRVAVVVDTPS